MTENIKSEIPPPPPRNKGGRRGARSAARKTFGLKRLIAERGFGGIIAGIRRDEESIRAKERIFSPRAVDGEWNFQDQPPEFWNFYHANYPAGVHVRIHPLLQWREIDIWRYIQREKMPIIDLYLAKNGKRYRSLGDKDITNPMVSDADTIEKIITELETTRQSERAGRAMDHESEDAFERLRRSGYM